MLKLIVLSFLTTTAYAATLEVVAKPYSFELAPEYQAILAQLKLHGDFADKSLAPKALSRGEQVVAEAKARNKALIAAQNKVPETSESELDKWKREDHKTREGWKNEVQSQLNQWKKEQEIFLRKLKGYKENTFVLPLKKEVIVEKKVIENLPEVFIVNGAFNIPIKDQSARATCSAFAGVRALEIILNQNQVNKDLSEQYFYWASKPDCQTAPCVQKGSWVTSAYRYSQKHPQIDIPTEEDCGYQSGIKDKNETQIPLAGNCQQGVAKVEAFKDVRTLSDVIDTLKTNTPVIVAAKLSENFYKNQGLITLEEAEKTPRKKLDIHALGHAFLAVGVMELPEKLKAAEGRFCLVVANSWGKGWGAGGYSCITEKWFAKYRQLAPFVAVTKISSK